jgi:hypothetical protein
MALIKKIGILAQLGLLILINYYALHVKNGDNQTSLDVMFCGTFFTSLSLLLLVVSKLIWTEIDKLSWIFISLLCIIGINFFLFDFFNIMVEYDRWLDKGMPGKPFWF